MNVRLQPTSPVEYPDSDGKPMADNTVQFRWVMTIQGNLDALFRDRPDVFVAGDHLIYPVRGQPEVRAAPDVYVAFGRPKGDRGSYKVWDEGGVFPQVVFEVLSPGNSYSEMAEKRKFYQKHGAEEYYVIDPDAGEAEVWVREDGRFEEVDEVDGFASPRLGVRLDTTGGALTFTRPDGRRFLTFVELEQNATAERRRAEQERTRAEQERARAEVERERADQEQHRADAERRRAEQERARADALAAKLRELGVDPDAV